MIASGNPDSPPLRAERLRRRYGGRLIVDVDALHVGAGEVLAVLGPNGAGKSTLFRLLLLLERADEGLVRFHGREVRAGDRTAMRSMAGVFQRAFGFAGTVQDNVAYGLRVRGVARAERRARALHALDWLGVRHLATAPMSALSGGEHQRVALARALVLEPALLFLDEPTSNLDVTVRQRFREELGRVVRGHAGGVVLITHDPGDAFALADRIAVLEAGRVTQTGTPLELVLSPASPFIAAFTGAELLLNGEVAEVEDGMANILFASRITARAALAPGQSLTPGQAVHVAYRPEDVTLTLADRDEATSARNRFAVRVAGITPAGALLRIRLEGPVSLAALITRESAALLSLENGVRIVARLKASALRVFAGARAG